MPQRAPFHHHHSERGAPKARRQHVACPDIVMGRQLLLDHLKYNHKPYRNRHTGKDRPHRSPISFAGGTHEVKCGLHYQSKETPNVLVD
jgi:hypothetical protein